MNEFKQADRVPEFIQAVQQGLYEACRAELNRIENTRDEAFAALNAEKNKAQFAHDQMLQSIVSEFEMREKSLKDDLKGRIAVYVLKEAELEKKFKGEQNRKDSEKQSQFGQNTKLFQRRADELMRVREEKVLIEHSAAARGFRFTAPVSLDVTLPADDKLDRALDELTSSRKEIETALTANPLTPVSRRELFWLLAIIPFFILWGVAGLFFTLFIYQPAANIDYSTAILAGSGLAVALGVIFVIVLRLKLARLKSNLGHLFGYGSYAAHVADAYKQYMEHAGRLEKLLQLRRETLQQALKTDDGSHEQQQLVAELNLKGELARVIDARGEIETEQRGLMLDAAHERDRKTELEHAAFAKLSSTVDGNLAGRKIDSDEALTALKLKFAAQTEAKRKEIAEFTWLTRRASAYWDDAVWQEAPAEASPEFAASAGWIVLKDHDLQARLPEIEWIFKIPALVPFNAERFILFNGEGDRREEAVAAIQNILLRALAHAPPGKMRFTFIDPVGLGEGAAPFMPLADADPLLITSRAWTDPRHIDEQLSKLTEHMENVIQKYLRHDYGDIVEYNAQAGEVAEAYRILVVYDFPANFNDSSVRRLESVIRNGPRCGVYTILHRNPTRPLPGGMNFDGDFGPLAFSYYSDLERQ